MTRSSRAIGGSDEEDAASLFQELHAHKLELEVQNEDLRRAQTDSEQALARYLELYHLAPVAYASLDPMGVVLEANRAAVDLLGLTGEQLLLSKLRSMVVRADEVILEKHLNDLFARGGSATAELRVRRGDGQERVVRLDSVLGPANGEQVRCRSAIVDITSLVRRETALRRLASAVSDADDAVFVLDLAGRIQTWNRGARELFGLSEADAIGESFARMVPAHRHQWFAGLLDRLARGARIRSLDAERVATDGRPILVSMSAFSLPGDTGRPEAACFSEHDVTARRAAETAQASRELKLRAVMDATLDANHHRRRARPHRGAQPDRRDDVRPHHRRGARPCPVLAAAAGRGARRRGWRRPRGAARHAAPGRCGQRPARRRVGLSGARLGRREPLRGPGLLLLRRPRRRPGGLSAQPRAPRGRLGGSGSLLCTVLRTAHSMRPILSRLPDGLNTQLIALIAARAAAIAIRAASDGCLRPCVLGGV